MTKYKLEYIWLDGYAPAANLRGKTQIKEFAEFPKLEQLPLWGFDGSSTRQAEGKSSDCVLKPVAVYPDPARKNGVLVMCEVMMPDGVTPHPSNTRATVLDDATTANKAHRANQDRAHQSLNDAYRTLTKTQDTARRIKDRLHKARAHKARQHIR